MPVPPILSTETRDIQIPDIPRKLLIDGIPVLPRVRPTQNHLSTPTNRKKRVKNSLNRTTDIPEVPPRAALLDPDIQRLLRDLDELARLVVHLGQAECDGRVAVHMYGDFLRCCWVFREEGDVYVDDICWKEYAAVEQRDGLSRLYRRKVPARATLLVGNAV